MSFRFPYIYFIESEFEGKKYITPVNDYYESDIYNMPTSFLDKEVENLVAEQIVFNEEYHKFFYGYGYDNIFKIDGKNYTTVPYFGCSEGRNFKNSDTTLCNSVSRYMGFGEKNNFLNLQKNKKYCLNEKDIIGHKIIDSTKPQMKKIFDNFFEDVKFFLKVPRYYDGAITKPVFALFFANEKVCDGHNYKQYLISDRKDKYNDVVFKICFDEFEYLHKSLFSGHVNSHFSQESSEKIMNLFLKFKNKLEEKKLDLIYITNSKQFNMSMLLAYKEDFKFIVDDIFEFFQNQKNNNIEKGKWFRNRSEFMNIIIKDTEKNNNLETTWNLNI